MSKSDNIQKSKDKKNKKKNTTTSSSQQISVFPTDVFTVTYSNGEQYNLLDYDPSTKCKPVRKTDERNFSQNKGQSDSPGPIDSYDASAGIDTSGFKNANCKKIADYLLKKKINDQGDQLNGAQIVGILANIQQESNYSPSIVNSIGASGICQWLGGRATKMKDACGEQWANNLSGQVDYLWTELTNGYKSSVLTPMLNTVTENTKEMAYKAMEIFCKHYEIPGNYDTEIPKRKKIVDTLWKQIKFTGFQGSGKKYKLSEEIVKRLVVGCIAENGNSKKAIQAEASLMCNLAESSRGNKYNHDLYSYVCNSGWFASRTVNQIKSRGYRYITQNEYKWGYEVFVGGLRTVPQYIDEHDWFPNDISWIKYKGENDSKVYSGFKRGKLIPGKSILHNKYGSTYTFYMFFKPNNGGDPFGSTYYPKRYK